MFALYVISINSEWKADQFHSARCWHIAQPYLWSSVESYSRYVVMHIYDNPNVHKPIGFCGPDNKLAPQQNWYHMTGWMMWETERVCQTYDQIDNSKSEQDPHHSFTLTFYQPLTSLSVALFLLLLLSISFLLLQPLAEGDHSVGPQLYPETLQLCFQCQGDGEGLSPRTPPFSSPPTEKRPGKGLRLEGLSCCPGSNKVELILMENALSKC